MTDNEIKKALECHTKDDGVCDGCHLYPDNACVHILTKSALDLINRQQEEIEKLTINMNAFGLGMKREKENADIAKAEAVKEFAELFKSRSRDVARGEIGGCTYYMIGESFVDKIVKEMVGDTE